jgi:hypothetical protein
MRTTEDALRSLKKYIASSLGPEWEVRLAADDDIFNRPFARVRTTTPGTVMSQGSVTAEYRQSFSILCYPEEPETAEEARIVAARVEEKLFQALAVGTHTPSISQRVVGYKADPPTDPPTVPAVGTGFRRGHPKRIPLYDYTGIALTSPATEGDRDSRDFMRITGDPTITTLTDPNDALSVVVAAELRMSWVRFAAVPSEAMTVESVTVEEESP